MSLYEVEFRLYPNMLTAIRASKHASVLGCHCNSWLLPHVQRSTRLLPAALHTVEHIAPCSSKLCKERAHCEARKTSRSRPTVDSKSAVWGNAAELLTLWGSGSRVRAYRRYRKYNCCASTVLVVPRRSEYSEYRASTVKDSQERRLRYRCIGLG